MAHHDTDSKLVGQEERHIISESRQTHDASFAGLHDKREPGKARNPVPLHLQESEAELGSHPSGHLGAVGATLGATELACPATHAVRSPERHPAALKQQLVGP